MGCHLFLFHGLVGCRPHPVPYRSTTLEATVTPDGAVLGTRLVVTLGTRCRLSGYCSLYARAPRVCYVTAPCAAWVRE